MFGTNFYPPTKKNIAADKRLQRIYAITLEEYNHRLHNQGGVCAICKRPPKKFRLAVDHDHRYDRAKIKLIHSPDKTHFIAFAQVSGEDFTTTNCDRKLAKATVRTMLKRRSIRGLLCMSCNKGLQYYRDIPERFDAAAIYLRKFNHEPIPNMFYGAGLSKSLFPPPLGNSTPQPPPARL